MGITVRQKLSPTHVNSHSKQQKGAHLLARDLSTTQHDAAWQCKDCGAVLDKFPQSLNLKMTPAAAPNPDNNLPL